MKQLLALCTALAAALPIACASGGAPRLQSARAATISNAQSYDGLYLAGQPAREELDRLARAGVKRVINLREPGEFTGFDERAHVEGLGLEYVELPFGSPEELTDPMLDRARALLAQAPERPTLVHCGSGNRVGALWLAYRTLDAGVAWDAAIAEAKRIGLKSPAYQERVKVYVETRRR